MLNMKGLAKWTLMFGAIGIVVLLFLQAKNILERAEEKKRADEQTISSISEATGMVDALLRLEIENEGETYNGMFVRSDAAKKHIQKLKIRLSAHPLSDERQWKAIDYLNFLHKIVHLQETSDKKLLVSQRKLEERLRLSARYPFSCHAEWVVPCKNTRSQLDLAESESRAAMEEAEKFSNDFRKSVEEMRAQAGSFHELLRPASTLDPDMLSSVLKATQPLPAT